MEGAHPVHALPFTGNTAFMLGNEVRPGRAVGGLQSWQGPRGVWRAAWRALRALTLGNEVRPGRQGGRRQGSAGTTLACVWHRATRVHGLPAHGYACLLPLPCRARA